MESLCCLDIIRYKHEKENFLLRVYTWTKWTHKITKSEYKVNTKESEINEIEGNLSYSEQNVLAVSKEIVPSTLKEALNDFIQLQKAPGNDKVFSCFFGVSSDLVPVESTKSIPPDVVDGRKKEFLKREKKATEDTIEMGKEEKLSIYSMQWKSKKSGHQNV